MIKKDNLCEKGGVLMKTLKPIVAFGVILLLAAGVFAQDAAVSFRTGELPATWCPIMDPVGPLADGSFIGVYLVGGNGIVDPCGDFGAPGGDDERATGNPIGNGTDHLIMGYNEPPFIPDGNLFTGNGAVAIPPSGTGTEPVVNQGDTGFLRAFNGVTPDVATHYNDLITVGGASQNTFLYSAPGPVTTIVCFGPAVEVPGGAPCVPQEAAGPEGPVTILAGETHYFFGDECTLWITAGTGPVTVTATLVDLEPPCKPFPATTYMTRYYDLEGTVDSFFDINFGYSQTDYDASDFGTDESLLHVAWYSGNPSACDGDWMKALPTTVTDTPEGGSAHVNVDHFSLWSFGWDGGNTQLPVELSSFVGEAWDGMAKLIWVTASETNNRGFHIERSTDGENFNRIAWVASTSEGATETEYTYEDNNVTNSVLYTYRLVDEDINGMETIQEMTVEVVPSFLSDAIVIDEYALHQNYPNPFNPTTSIIYDVKDEGLVTLKVYNVMGQEVATLVNAERGNGRYAVSFDATGLSSGLYFYTVKVNNFSATKKMLLVQ
jgi:hypothetical protein